MHARGMRGGAPAWRDPIIGLPDETIEAAALRYKLGGWWLVMSFENFLRAALRMEVLW
jgi:hypothetical protein